MAYGTAGGVAALTYRYAGSAFSGTTNPTSTTVTAWLAQLNSMMDIALSAAGFTTPITDADVTPALDGFVNAMVADLVHAANSTGRFFSDYNLERGINPMAVINKDVKAWVEDNAYGLVALGATRITQARGITITSTVVNPQYKRTVVEDNSADADDDEIGVLVT